MFDWHLEFCKSVTVGPTKDNRQNFYILGLFRSMEKIASDGPKWGQEDFFPTHPDLADILGRTD